MTKTQEKVMNELWAKQEATEGCKTWEDVENKFAGNPNFEVSDLYIDRVVNEHVLETIVDHSEFKKLIVNGLYGIRAKNETLFKLEKLGYIEIVEFNGFYDIVRILKNRI